MKRKYFVYLYNPNLSSSPLRSKEPNDTSNIRLCADYDTAASEAERLVKENPGWEVKIGQFTESVRQSNTPYIWETL